MGIAKSISIFYSLFDTLFTPPPPLPRRKNYTLYVVSHSNILYLIWLVSVASQVWLVRGLIWRAE
jgi:hypothetical protein